MWEGDNSEVEAISDEKKDLKRTKLSIKSLMDSEASKESLTFKEELESEGEVDTVEDENKRLVDPSFFDGAEEEIDIVEDVVETLEDGSYPEEFEAENQIEPKNEDIMKLIHTIDNQDNEILR